MYKTVKFSIIHSTSRAANYECLSPLKKFYTEYDYNMKILYYAFVLITAFSISGCVIPAEMFFRNKSDSVVRLTGKLIDRRYFDRLPNKVSFYDLPEKEKQIYGEWRETKFVTWLDTTNFFIDVPIKTIIDLEDVTDNFSLGLAFPRVIVIATTKDKTDTLARGDYSDIFSSKFKEKRRFLGTSTFYYDFE